MSNISSLQNLLPKIDVILKTIDMNDSVTGMANINNLNFEEIARLLNLYRDVFTEIISLTDLTQLVSQTIDVIEKSKKHFNLPYSLVNDAEIVTEYFGELYRTKRIDDYSYKIEKLDPLIGNIETIWDVTHIISQVKDYEGNIVNVAINTSENSITIRFNNVIEKDHLLLIL